MSKWYIFAMNEQGSQITGFPSPADDYVEHTLDISKYIIKNPSSTFFMRTKGQTLKEAGIYPYDVIAVDRSLTPKSGSCVVGIVNGEFILKKIKILNGQYYLVSEDFRIEPILLTDDIDSQIWGVVTTSIHSL